VPTGRDDLAQQRHVGHRVDALGIRQRIDRRGRVDDDRVGDLAAVELHLQAGDGGLGGQREAVDDLVVVAAAVAQRLLRGDLGDRTFELHGERVRVLGDVGDAFGGVQVGVGVGRARGRRGGEEWREERGEDGSAGGESHEGIVRGETTIFPSREPQVPVVTRECHVFVIGVGAGRAARASGIGPGVSGPPDMACDPDARGGEARVISRSSRWRGPCHLPAHNPSRRRERSWRSRRSRSTSRR
jgi:hypothetical protein